MSDLRLRRRPISKTVEKVPDPIHIRKVEREDISQIIKIDVRLGSQKNEVGDVRSQKKVRYPQRTKWKLWSDSCGAQLAPGLKPLRLPRAGLVR